jgi:hypothetical protein
MIFINFYRVLSSDSRAVAPSSTPFRNGIIRCGGVSFLKANDIGREWKLNAESREPIGETNDFPPKIC